MGTLLEGGHKDAVLCTAVSADSHVISGGEGGELCVWSLDGSAPQKYNISTNGDDVTSICCSKNKPHEIYAACGHKIIKFDLRDMPKPCLVLDHNEDEVNQIVLHEKEEFVAACDDSGQVKILHMGEKRVYKTLRRHTNICMAVAFRPRRPWDVLSAGFDYQLLQWDFSRAKCVCHIDMQEVGLDSPLPEANILSPPFVYSMAVSPSGRQVACGTENALIQLFDGSRRTLAFVASLRGHTSGVSQVHFPATMEHTLVSGGNDGKIFIWDTRPCFKDSEQQVQNGCAPQPVQNGVANGVHHNDIANGVANGIQNGVANGIQNGVANGIQNGVANGIQNGVANGIHNGVANGIHNGVANGVANGIEHHIGNGVANGVANGVGHGHNIPKHPSLVRPKLTPKMHINHNSKINCLSSVCKNGQLILVVADSSSNITLYNIPE